MVPSASQNSALLIVKLNKNLTTVDNPRIIVTPDQVFESRAA